MSNEMRRERKDAIPSSSFFLGWPDAIKVRRAKPVKYLRPCRGRPDGIIGKQAAGPHVRLNWDVLNHLTTM